MAFNFTCPHCYKKTLVDEAMVGQSGPCVRCGKEVLITLPAGHAPAVRSPSNSEGSAADVTTASETQLPPQVRPSPNRLLVSRILTACSILLAALLIFVGGFFLVRPTLVGLKARHDRAACMNNLHQIAKALNAYAAEYGTYPPPVVYNASGKPMHSWRVLILKQLGEVSLYERYNFGEPWDSASNSQMLGSNCPQVYVSPVAAGSRNTAETNYFLVTGQNTIFPPAGPLGPNEIGDSSSKTLLVVETDNAIIEWTNPQDINFAKLNARIGATGPNTIGGSHAGGATAVFADGAPAWLPDDITPEVLDSLITPDGGEPVDPARFQPR